MLEFRINKSQKHTQKWEEEKEAEEEAMAVEVLL